MKLQSLLNKLIPYAAVGTLFFGSGCSTVDHSSIDNSVTEYSKSSSAYTIGHELIDHEAEFTFRDYSLLDELIEEAKIRIKPKTKLTGHYSKEEALEILETIKQIIKEKGFTYKKNLFLFQGLKTKEIDCDNYSIIYASIGEALGLPITTVIVPDHMFVRWNFSHDDYVNWETVFGKEEEDQYYIDAMNIDPKAIEQKVFLQNLSREEMLAVHFVNLGSYHYSKFTAIEKKKAHREYDLALAYFQDALALHPTFALAHTLYGLTLSSDGKNREAMMHLKEALKLDPGDKRANILKSVITFTQDYFNL